MASSAAESSSPLPSRPRADAIRMLRSSIASRAERALQTVGDCLARNLFEERMIALERGEKTEERGESRRALQFHPALEDRRLENSGRHLAHRVVMRHALSRERRGDETRERASSRKENAETRAMLRRRETDARRRRSLRLVRAYRGRRGTMSCVRIRLDR